MAKPPFISVLGYANPALRETYERTAMERHNELFRQFGLQPPAPDAVGDPVWRDLALKLARKHEDAFKGKVGRPATSRDSHIRWQLASYLFQIRDGLNEADAARQVATHFELDYATVKSGLKELRRTTTGSFNFAKQGLDPAISKARDLLGDDAIVAALQEALTPDADFDAALHEEVERIERWPY